MTGIFASLAVFAAAAAPVSTNCPKTVPRLATPTALAKPMFVVMELNPWLAVVASDSARFVLYEDGRLLTLGLDGNGRPTGYLETTLSANELKTFVDRLAIDRLGSMPEMHESSDATDQTTTMLISFRDGKRVTRSVYGPLESEPGAFTTHFQAPDAAFVDIYKTAVGYKPPRSHEFVPEVVELMFWDYSHALGAMAWPACWPGPESAAKPLTSGAVGMIFFDGRDLDLIKGFLRNLGDRTAVRMGEYWYSVGLRIVIPGEEKWGHASAPH